MLDVIKQEPVAFLLLGVLIVVAIVVYFYAGRGRGIPVKK